MWWLIGVVVFVLLWGGLWRAQPKAAFGVLLGLLLAWLFSRTHYSLCDRYGIKSPSGFRRCR